MTTILDGNRSAIYSALAPVFGALLGFVLTAVSLVLGFSAMEQLAIVRGSPHYETLYKIYLQATWLLALATHVALAGLILDRDAGPVNAILYATVLQAGWPPYALPGAFGPWNSSSFWSSRTHSRHRSAQRREGVRREPKAAAVDAGQRLPRYLTQLKPNSLSLPPRVRFARITWLGGPGPI